MLRPDLIATDAFLKDALQLTPAQFLTRHPSPMLVIHEPDWEKIKRLSRPEVLGPGGPPPAVLDLLLDPTRSRATAASLDALCLEVRPRTGDPDRITFGRSPDSDLILLDETISKLHAEMLWDAPKERSVLTDLGSRNGTYVDGTRLQPQTPIELMTGAVISFGSLASRYYTPRAFRRWLLKEARKV